jgi:hypothetical protein
MKAPIDELHCILTKITKNDNVEDCLEAILKIGNSAAKRIFGSIQCEKDYFIIKETAHVLQSAALFYFIRALEKHKRQDSISCLAYASFAAGINAVFMTKFLPTLQRYAPFYRAEGEISYIQKINSYMEQKINEITLRAIEDISKSDHMKIKQKLDETVQTMVSLSTNITTEIRNVAVTLCKKFPAGDFKQARRLYEYVRDEITYIYDPRNVEEVQPPEITLKLHAGDCDDKAVLLASLLLSIGFETCFFIADTNNDGYPDHVYVGVYLPDAPEIYKPLPEKLLDDGRNLHDWIPLDPACEDSDFGVIPLNDIGILRYVPITT